MRGGVKRESLPRNTHSMRRLYGWRKEKTEWQNQGPLLPLINSHYPQVLRPKPGTGSLLIKGVLIGFHSRSVEGKNLDFPKETKKL